MSATIDDAIQRRVDKVEDLAIRSRVPVLLGVGYVLQLTCSDSQALSNFSWDGAVGVPHSIEATSLGNL